MRVIQQRSQLAEQLMFPLPDRTQFGVALLGALCLLALVLHVEESLQQRLGLAHREVFAVSA